MRTYDATQIQRVDSPDPTTTFWSVELDAGRTGRLRLPLDAYAAVEATDKDAYVREALADHLTWRQVPDDELLAGRHVARL